MRFRMVHRFEPKGAAKQALASVAALYREEIPRQLYLPRNDAATLIEERIARLTKAQHPIYLYKLAEQARGNVLNALRPASIEAADALLLGHYGCGFYGGAGFPDGEPRISFFLKGATGSVLIGFDNLGIGNTGMFSMLLPFGSEAEQKYAKGVCEQLIDAQCVSTIFEVDAEQERLAYVRSPFGHLRPASVEELNLDAVVRLYAEAFLTALQRKWM
jgi:hypothetical protein